MSVPGLIHRLLLPPARRRPLRPGWWVPVATLAAIATGLAMAVLSGRLSFAQPWWLAVLPLPAWWCWRVAAAGWSGLSPLRAVLAVMVRTLLVAAAIIALAEPCLTRSRDDLALVYCIDVSDSVSPPAVEAVKKWMLTTVGGKPARDTAGLVAFGRDAAVELPPRQAFPFETFATRIDHGGTDLERALLTAADAIPEDRPGRVVLASDGAGNGGDVLRAASQLAARGIAVDVLPISYQHDAEAWLERLDLPRDVRPHETYDAGVLLSAISRGAGSLVLNENGREVARQRITWEPGRSRFRLPLSLRGPGSYDYLARLEPDPGTDGWRENNLALGRIDLAGDSRLLLLVDPGGKAADWSRLEAALSAGSRVVERKPAWECPDDPLALEPYDAVLLVNVPAEQLDAAQQRALRDAVHDLGTGLVMVGGGNSFGPGGWSHTPVEDALPVTMETAGRRVMPKGALVIVLHTCEFPEGNTWAKRITKQAIRVLSAEDEVGVIDFGNTGAGWGDHWIFPMSKAGDYDRLAPLIEAAEPADMPSFAPVLQQAHDALAASDAAAKHCIIISDGDPSPPPPALIAAMVKDRISISTVTVFPHGDVNPPEFTAIATATGGRAYYPRDAGLLPGIFIKEAKTLRRSQVQNVRFTPRPMWPSPALKGLGATPDQTGFVLTTPKPGSQTALLGPKDDDESPVLISWRFGIGAAAAFTGDLGSNWGAEWTAWNRYAAFCEQLALSVGKVRARGFLRIATEAGADAVEVTVEDQHPAGGSLALSARLVQPSGADAPLELRETAPGRWRGRAQLSGTGRYRVVVAGNGTSGEGATRDERAVSGFAIAYSPEYRRFRSDPMLLERIARMTGGRMLDDRADAKLLWDVARTPRVASTPAARWAIALLACLLPLDLAVRRLRLDPLAWFSRKRGAGASDEGMGRLLAAKRRAATQAEPTAQPPIILPAKSGPAAAAPPPPKPRPTAPPSASPPGSTAGRLLDAKRKRQSDNQKPGT